MEENRVEPDLNAEANLAIEPSITEVLQDLVIDSDDVASFLEDLCHIAAETVSSTMEVAVNCAVTLRRHRKTTTIAWSTPDAKILDEVQHAYGEGPCLHAMHTGTTVLVSDTRTDTRWPEYCSAIATAGQLSVLGVPLTLDEGAKAALNVFALDADAFEPAIIHSTELFAAQAERALRLTVRIAGKQELANDLREAMKSRTAIDLASGMIMAQNRCSQSEAFEMLSRASSNRNVKLRVVAEEMIERLTNASPTSHFEG